jgi:AraC-like DNA-binding protein/mannose-6-phosphate isomerase-like protein (cupin superfamily)
VLDSSLIDPPEPDALEKLRDREPVIQGIFPSPAPLRLHAMLTCAGLEHQSGPGYDWDGMKRSEAQFAVIQHTFAGAGRLDYEGQRLRIGPGQTMLVHIPHPHRYRCEPGQPWDFFFICLNGVEAMRLMRALISRHGPRLNLSEPTLRRLAGICWEVLRAPRMGPGRASALAYLAVTSLVDELMAVRATASSLPMPIARVVSLIERDLQADLSVPALAEASGMSRSHFTRLFTASVGRSPAQFVFEQRMRRAAQLLQTSELSVKQIATACGFNDPAYFSKAFHRYFELSPTELRDSGMYRG